MTFLRRLSSLFKILSTVIFLIFFQLAVPAAWATYEVSSITANAPVSTPTQWTDDLTVSWTAPTMTGSDVLNGFIYKWSPSATPLVDIDFSINTGKDGFIASDMPFAVIKSKTELARLDSGDPLYLHMKTFYLSDGLHQRYSTDIVTGPFMLDNVAPTGTVRIVDLTGNDIGQTSNTSVRIEVASGGATKVYLNESSEILTSLQLTYSTYVEYPFANVTPGAKTLYVWFEDAVGNISSSPVTDTVTLLASISPNRTTIYLASGGLKEFHVEGTSATYNWSIINEVPETSGTVAQFSGLSSGVNAVTVQGLVKGTFQLRAVPTTGGDTLTSGILTVSQLANSYNIYLSAGWNLISIPVQPVNSAISALLAGITGKYSIVWGEFNPTTSAWKNYIPTKPTNTLTTVEPNRGYWIYVTEACTLTVTGDAAAKSVLLLTGWNLIGFTGDADTAIGPVLSSITGKYSIVWGEFNPATSAWKNYIPAKPTNTLNTMSVGKGYWIYTTEITTLSY